MSAQQLVHIDPEGTIRQLKAKIARLEKALAAQPAVPLTNEQAHLLINGRGDEGDDDYVEPTGDGYGLTDADLVKLIRRVEAHHGIDAKVGSQPAAWVGLTDEELYAVRVPMSPEEIARAVEQRLKEKNGGA
jgi:hypothetical protein